VLVVDGAELVAGVDEEVPVELHATKAIIDNVAATDLAPARAMRAVDMCSTLRSHVPTDGQRWVSVR
jgi:hypothetical protein